MESIKGSVEITRPMIDILEEFGKLSYLGIFLLLVGINASPILMPPSWIVLASFYTVNPELNILGLALVGATGSLIGRIILMYISRLFRKFMGPERKSSLERLDQFIKNKKYGFFSLSFLFALTPLPSNMLFMAYGIMEAKSLGIFVGFWAGRAIAYYVMISISNVTLKRFIELFHNSLAGILVTDVGSLVLIVLFASVNWTKLITTRKLEFVKPKLWRF